MPTFAHWLDFPEQRRDPWPQAAYLHIPFCRQRCYYCDFATGLGTADLIETYVEVLCQEIEQMPVGDQPLTSIFFGGGTPSLLSGEQLSRILSRLQQRIPWSADIEISLEANPGTISRSQLLDYRHAGVNRVSLGVQAFQPKLLAACGRGHGVEAVYQAVADLRAVGLENFNLDLIFGLPQQTLLDWQESLTALTGLHPTHVSLYDLTIEPHTRFGRTYQPGDPPLPSDADTVQMYHLAIQELTAAGYQHYEISNFAQTGYQCRHNRVYWQNGSYYGLGMGAVGYIKGQRIKQPQKLYDYFQQVQKGEIWQDATPTSLVEEWQNTLMLGLRLREGLSLSELRSRFAEPWVEAALDCLAPYVEKGWAACRDDDLRLLPPEGWLFSNTILTDLFAIPESC
ncbi:MAG: radical SAM family heme chaperone HemW [Cyanobacteriota bacterium]|nr:radical SAM family heme chaperone HemW [Cyanobacteriota bacterium]